jgi:hypothetical protein
MIIEFDTALEQLKSGRGTSNGTTHDQMLGYLAVIDDSELSTVNHVVLDGLTDEQIAELGVEL